MSATLLPFPQHRVRPFLSLKERAVIEAAIEGLLTILDQADGDPECEDTAPEKYGDGFARCSPDDCEDSRDAEAVNEDGDPLDHGEFEEAEAVDRWHAKFEDA